MADLTAIILAKDEAGNIERCLRSVEGFAKRRIVVDSGSLDDTVAIARSLGAEVLSHPFENYARQFNWALDAAGIDTRWVLRLDADESFPPALIDALEPLLAQHADDGVDGFLMEANFYFLGRLIRHGGPKKRKIMIFRYGRGRIEDRRMDEHTVVDGEVIALRERFDHHDFKDLDTWISKMNWYATREMQDYFESLGHSGEAMSEKHLSSLRRKKFGIYYRVPKFLRCQLLFLYNYIFRLGFLDGREGFIYHWMYQRWYRTLVDAKIFEQEKFPRPFARTGALGATAFDRDGNASDR